MGLVAQSAQAEGPADSSLPRHSGQKVDELLAAVAKGGIVQLEPGVYELKSSLVLPSRTLLKGAGRGVTILKLAEGANVDVVRTAGFDELQGQSSLAQAPSDITVRDLSIDGSFLSSTWTDPERRVLNTKGSCLAVHGRRLNIDVEAYNCPQHLLYSEGQGPRQSQEVSSRIRLDGLVAGEECVVFRGAGDSRLEHLGAGVCGAKRMQSATKAERSRWYGSESGYDGLVIERRPPYEGTLEIGFAHVFGSFFGWGVRTYGNPRLHAVHLISESNLGGVLIDKLTWGAIALLDIHSNGKSMGAQPRPEPRAALRVESEVGFSVSHGTVLRSIGSAEGFTAAELAGRHGQFNLVLLNSRNPQTGRDHEGAGVVLTGSHNLVQVTGSRVQGVVVSDSGKNNKVLSVVATPD